MITEFLGCWGSVLTSGCVLVGLSLLITWRLNRNLKAIEESVAKALKRPSGESESTIASNTSDSGFFRGLMTHHVAQDRLLWSRLQSLAVLQVAALAGAYSIYEKHNGVLSIIVLCLALSLTRRLDQLMDTDRNIRKGHERLLNRIGTSLKIKVVRDLEIPSTDDGYFTSPFVVNPSIGKVGPSVQKSIIRSLVVADVSLIIAIVLCQTWPWLRVQLGC